jgi:hypothetical protein
MSEQAGVPGVTGPAASKETRDAVEPLVQHMMDQPVCTALIILAIGFVLGKIL